MHEKKKWIVAAMTAMMASTTLCTMNSSAVTEVQQREETVSNITSNTATQNAKVYAQVQSAIPAVDTFMDTIAPDVVALSEQYGLYGSVMMAQAVLESQYGLSKLASAPNFNLFGMKGTYNGKSVSLPTLEDNGKGQYYTITAKFRKYPSYRESLEDYAKKLRYGLSWNATYYQKTWLENTRSYKDATAALTGTYATDTHYGTKLNNVIAKYDLTKYDPKKATTSTTTNSTVTQVSNTTTLTTGTKYTVKKGDTLSAIAKKYNTTTKKIVAWNGLKTTTIFIGQKLFVSDKKAVKATTVKKKATVHTVKKGDTLTKVSKQYNVTIKNLKKWNGLSSTTIKVGQKLKLTATAKATVKVVKGDTLTKIAKKNGTTTTNLKKWNKLKTTTIKIGQQLRVTKA